jgi:hypothetical protein
MPKKSPEKVRTHNIFRVPTLITMGGESVNTAFRRQSSLVPLAFQKKNGFREKELTHHDYEDIFRLVDQTKRGPEGKLWDENQTLRKDGKKSSGRCLTVW